jgi:hypothetical protein
MTDRNQFERFGLIGPYHKFYLVGTSVTYNESFEYACTNKAQAICSLPDDLLRYFNDFIMWIPSTFIVDGQTIESVGLDYEGWSIINLKGKDTAIAICERLVDLFIMAPPVVRLTGLFEQDSKGGNYRIINIERDFVLDALHHIADVLAKIDQESYVLHLGV